MKKHSAFTLIELIMVIIVMGIVASIGADIIASMYENYLRTRAINRLQTQAEITLEQIAKRLQYRIKDSVRAWDIDTNTTTPLAQADATYEGMEWIGYSNESFLGGWSGFLDFENNETNKSVRTLSTPGSNLTYAGTIINALTYSDIDMSTATGDLPALIFKNPKTPFDINKYYSQGTNNYTLRVYRDDDNSFHIPSDDNVTDFNGDGEGDLFENYVLSHTAYALIPVGSSDDFNLTLFYNYQPWQAGEGNYTTANAESRVLAEHVSTFRFLQQGTTMRLKLCIHDNNQSGDFDFSACKETVVY